MRPVERGPRPLDEEGAPKGFHPYQKAKADLLTRLGGYCNYCERTGDLHVEHVIPRNRRPDLEEDWRNFLLGCGNCNSIKSDRNLSREGYVWPDRDDTSRSFEYLPDGIVKVREDISEQDRVRAEGLFELVGLGRRPSNDPCARDLRWRKRRAAWRKAEFARNKFEQGADIDLVVKLAKATGFWSVWMTVFAAHPRIRDRLRQCFPGTR